MRASANNAFGLHAPVVALGVGAWYMRKCHGLARQRMPRTNECHVATRVDARVLLHELVMSKEHFLKPTQPTVRDAKRVVHLSVEALGTSKDTDDSFFKEKCKLSMLINLNQLNINKIGGTKIHREPTL
jgi:hypothetical protein